jgi:ribosomal-protein-alanine N-acetyltransferase
MGEPAPYVDIVIASERVSLRAWRVEDAEAAFGIWGSHAVADWLYLEPTPDVEAQERELAALIVRYTEVGGGFGNLALVPVDVGRPVGAIMLKPLGTTGLVEVGWHVDPAFWGRGYASEGGRIAVRYGFADLGLDAIHAIVLPENARSQAVAHRVGLADTGRMQLWADREHTLFRAEREAWLAREGTLGDFLG